MTNYDRAAYQQEYRPRGTPQYFEGDIPRISWDEFLEAFEWRTGNHDAQHITLIAKTRDGKSHLASMLEERRKFAVVMAAKPPGDPALERLKKQGFVHVQRWPWRGNWNEPRFDPDKGARVLLWPNIRTIEDLPAKRPIFQEALDRIFTQGGWTVRIDEGIYSCAPHFLNLRHRLEDYWQRASSNNISLEFLCQRSSTVPLLAYDQIGHLFAGRCNDRKDAERIGEMASQDRLMVRDCLQQLHRFEFLWMDHDNDTLAIIKAPPPAASVDRGRR